MKSSLSQLGDFFQDNPEIWYWLMGFSGIAFIATLVLIPWMMLQIPEDYFAGETPHRPLWLDMHPVFRALLLLAKNLLGLSLVLVGIALLVLPGQGILSIVFGILLLDFPRRYELKRWMIQRPSILRTVNWLRQRYHRPPLRFHGERN